LETNSTQTSGFGYHPLLNSTYLQKLYGEDYESAIMVFGGFCDESASYISDMSACFNKADKTGLMEHLHKISSSYGYLGLPQFSQRIKDFIAQCKAAPRLEYVLSDYETLYHDMVAYHKVIHQVHDQMQQYNLAHAS
jgi:HPt (histidine-containing phosphotransfer) domain-containing protein